MLINYCEDDIYETALNLLQLENNYSSVGFLRISKSMVVNLYKIKRLKSYTSGRIEVIMKNDEKIIVSRHYAPMLRQKLDIQDVNLKLKIYLKNEMRDNYEFVQ